LLAASVNTATGTSKSIFLAKWPACKLSFAAVQNFDSISPGGGMDNRANASILLRIVAAILCLFFFVAVFQVESLAQSNPTPPTQTISLTLKDATFRRAAGSKSYSASA
jgi:hypothetical protein